MDEVLDGIKLVGTANMSKAFPAGFTAAQQSVQLQNQATLGGEGHQLVSSSRVW